MSFWEPGMDDFPHQLKGMLKRTSGPLKEGIDDVVYLHLEEIAQTAFGSLRASKEETPLTFKVTLNVSLTALMARSGDVVFVEWIPSACIKQANIGAGLVATVTKFHLARHVSRLFGDGFDKPDWFFGPRFG